MTETVTSTVPNKELMIALLYFGKVSLQTYTGISSAMKNKLPYCNLQV